VFPGQADSIGGNGMGIKAATPEDRQIASRPLVCGKTNLQKMEFRQDRVNPVSHELRRSEFWEGKYRAAVCQPGKNVSGPGKVQRKS